MNAVFHARQAYAPTQTAIRTDRAIEADLFARATGRLQKAKQTAPTDYAALVAATHENKRLWTTMAMSVADSENQLPPMLRAQLFYLAEFTDHQTTQVLNGSGDVQVLIDINLAVLRGLNSQSA